MSDRISTIRRYNVTSGNDTIMKACEYNYTVADRECLRYTLEIVCKVLGIQKWLASHYPYVTFEGETEDKYRNYKIRLILAT